jgi:hypothetical protein
MSTERPDARPDASDSASGGTNGWHGPSPSPDLGQHRLYLTAQCAKLRHWCRDLLDISPAAPSLPGTVADDLRDTPPIMSLDEVSGVFRSQRDAGLSFPDLSPESPDQEVRRLSQEREGLRNTLFTLIDAVEPYEPITEAELQDILHSPRGERLEDILAEFERKIVGHDAR